ncbi:hypothetical protein EYR40_006110 [Pleurotus pulmonarius]|nr:hypothetical protein EYR36_010731 [Pleurotus pulmonarius]KAF4599022.1 hypothetical protein EYR40_006110 [Pleurotus pulmonarius]
MSKAMNPLQRRGINKLPLELLVEIFYLASTNNFVKERTVPPSYTLFELSHVCGSWRTAIRGAPQLWTMVCGIEPPEMIHEIIALSQKMPLAIVRVEKSDDQGDTEKSEEEHRDEGDEDDAEEWHGIEDNDDVDAEEWHGIEWEEEDSTNEPHEGIHIDIDGEGIDEEDHESDYEEDESDYEEDESDYEEDESDYEDEDNSFGLTPKDTAKILLAQLHRMSSINISLDGNDARGLLPLLDGDAPLLEFLGLRVVGRDALVVIHPFRGTAPPRLTTLVLIGGCELSLSSSLWANLTQLYLSKTHHRDAYHADGGFVPFSRALAQMSSLKDLNMTFVIPPNICDLDPSAVPAIDLPSLTSLTIQDMTSRCVLFLPSLHCHLATLNITSGEDVDHADYEEYEENYYYLLQVCGEHMAAALTQDPLSLIKLKRTPQGFLMMGTRSARTSDHEQVGPVSIELVHGMPLGTSMVTEELVTHAITVVPPRETDTLLVELEDIDGLDIPLVAWYLHGLPGIRVDTITMSGYEEEWRHALEDQHSTGSGGAAELAL